MVEQDLLHSKANGCCVYIKVRNARKAKIPCRKVFSQMFFFLNFEIKYCITDLFNQNKWTVKLSVLE